MEYARRKWRLQILVLLGVGIYLIMWPWGTWPIVKGLALFPTILQLGLPKVGDALVIAGVIAALVDRAVKRDLLSEFAADISHHIVGHMLPPALREHVRRYLRVEVVRKSWIIDYEIEPQNDPVGFVKVTTRSTYEMENCSAGPAKYKHEFSVEQVALGGAMPAIISFAVISPNKNECFQFRPEDSGVCPATVDGWLVLSREVTMPRAPHPAYTFVAESIEFCPQTYTDHFVASYPTLKTTITVYYPKDKMTVHLSLSCDDAGYPIERIEVGRGTQWLIETPLLQGQSIITRWEPLQRPSKTVAPPDLADTLANRVAPPVLPAEQGDDLT